MKKIDKKELHNLFLGIAEKEERKFNQLYESYHKLVYGIAFSITKNKENSEDITQNVFYKIWHIPKQNLPTSKEASWLYTMTKNEAIDFLRKEKTAISLENLYDIEDANHETEQIIGKENYNKIISKLDEKEKEIVSLKILADLSFREIAQILNIPIATVQWRYYKALHTLKILITNLSIFMLTLGLLVRTKMTVPSNDHTNQEIAPEENVFQEDTSQKEQENNDYDAVEDATLSKEQNIVNENIAASETTQTTETIEHTITKEVPFSKTEIGLLSIAGIFLCITIIFSIIFIKHQQNQKKKTSK